MQSGIYQIVNTVNGRIYVGSAIDLQRRWNEHRYRLRKGNHHSRYMQRSWAKHGEPAFEFRPLLICASKDLLMYEQIILDGMKPHYNIAPIAGSSLGRKTSEETKRKLALANLGIKRSAETKERMAVARRARIEPIVSEETRRRQSEARKGMKMPPRTAEHIAKLAAARRKTTDYEIRQMKALLFAGVKQSVVARQFGCAASTVCLIASGKKYSEIS